jgi:formylglycine-generating enzyme required for sulfatase activity
MSCCEWAEVPPSRKEFEMKAKAQPTIRWTEEIECPEENYTETLEYMIVYGIAFCRVNMEEWEPLTWPVPTFPEA